MEPAERPLARPSLPHASNPAADAAPSPGAPRAAAVREAKRARPESPLARATRAARSAAARAVTLVPVPAVHRAPAPAPTSAVLIVTYNSRKYLADLFESLRRHTDLESTPLLVVDNASTDGTLDELHRIARDNPGMEILAQRENTGFTGGNNVGLRRARALGVRYVMLLNPDTVVQAGWLDQLVATLESRPDVAAAQPLLTLFDDPTRVNSAGNAIHFCGFNYCGSYRRPVDEVVGDGKVRPVTCATGAALLLRMEALDRIGDFDEQLFLYQEDSDLQIRLRQAGWECVLDPSVRVLHKYAADFTPQKYAWLERNRFIVLAKDWPAARLVAIAPALVAVEAAVFAYAVKQGFWREKLWAYREFAKRLPRTLEDRRRVQALRGPNASDARHLTGTLEFSGLDHPIITRVANPVLSAYWRVARGALEAAGLEH